MRSGKQEVPELTRNVGIQLNERLSLQRSAIALSVSAPDIVPIRTQHGKAVGRSYSARRPSFSEELPMIAGDDDHTMGGGKAPVDGHLFASIQRGRRYDGRHCQDKKFTAFRDEQRPPTKSRGLVDVTLRTTRLKVAAFAWRRRPANASRINI
jgi:hypothetical protein